MTDAELDALDRLCQQATAGPWTIVRRLDDKEAPASLGGPNPSGRTAVAMCPRYGLSAFLEADGPFIAAARTALPQLVAEVRLRRERTYERRCVGCAFARVEIVPENVDQREADTYCGNEDSPCHDRRVSFFGADICGHWVKGTPVHETPAQRRGEA